MILEFDEITIFNLQVLATTASAAAASGGGSTDFSFPWMAGKPGLAFDSDAMLVARSAAVSLRCQWVPRGALHASVGESGFIRAILLGSSYCNCKMSYET
jgi:hypothetical protein